MPSSPPKFILEAPAIERPKKKRANEEAAHQAAYFEALTRHEHKYPILKWVHASMNGRFSDPRVAATSKGQGLRKGIWDVHVPFPRGGYCGLWIEFKSSVGKLSPEQIEFRDCVISHSQPPPIFALYRDWTLALEATIAYLFEHDANWPQHLRGFALL